MGAPARDRRRFHPPHRLHGPAQGESAHPHLHARGRSRAGAGPRRLERRRRGALEPDLAQWPRRGVGRVPVHGRFAARTSRRAVRVGPVSGVGVLLAACWLVIAANVRAAGPVVSAHVELGYGGSTVPDLPSPSASAFSARVGASLPNPPLRLGFELAFTASEDIGISYIPEAPKHGQRSLATFLVGLEAAGGPHA